MPKSNAKNDNPDQTDEKLTTLESLLRMVSMADEQKILQEENDIYIYLAALRHLEERVGEKEQTVFFQKVHKVTQKIQQMFPSSSNTKKPLIETAKPPIETATALFTKIKRVPTPVELDKNGVTEAALQESITALFETSKAKKIKGLHTKITELKEKITLEKDQQEKGRIHDEKKAVSASIKKENAGQTIDLEIEDVSKTIDLEIKEARKTNDFEIEKALTNLRKLVRIHDEIKTVSASIKKENARKKINDEINKARRNLQELKELGLQDAINAKKGELLQDPFFRYKFAMTYCKTEKEEEDLKIIGIKLLSNQQVEEELNEFEKKLAAKFKKPLATKKENAKEPHIPRRGPLAAKFKKQLAAIKENAKEPHNPRRDVPPTQEVTYASTKENAAEKEAKVIASESLTDKGHLRKLGMSKFVTPAWEKVTPEDSFSMIGFNYQHSSANERYHKLFEQTHIMHDLFENMKANLTAHKPNYEEYAMGFFRADTQNLQEKLEKEFAQACRQQLHSKKREQQNALQKLKCTLTEEMKEELALFEKVGIGSELAAEINNIENHEGYEAFCGDYEATKENLSTRRKKQKEAFFPNKTTIDDTEGVKKAINALQPVQGFPTGPSIEPRIVMMYRISPSKDETIKEELLREIDQMQSNDWKIELRSPELLLQIGDNLAHENAYKAAMILHCDAVIEILNEQKTDTPPNYKTFLNDYFPLLPGEKLIQFFDIASPHLEGGTKTIVMDAIESHLASKSPDYLEELLKKTINVTLFDKIKNTLLIKTVNEKAPKVTELTRLDIQTQLTNLKSSHLFVEIEDVIKQLDALIANAPNKSPESIQKEQDALFAELNTLVDIKFIENMITGERPVYHAAKEKLKSIIEPEIITPYKLAVENIIEIKQTKIEQNPSTEISAKPEPESADIFKDAMAEISEPIASKSIAKNLLSTEETIKETEGIAHRMQIDDELTTINKGVEEEDKTAIQAVQKSILYFNGKAEIISSEHRIELVQQYKVVCKKYPDVMDAFGKEYPDVMADFDNLMPKKPLTSPIIEQANTFAAIKENVADCQKREGKHKTALDKAAKGEVIPGPKPRIEPGKGA